MRTNPPDRWTRHAPRPPHFPPLFRSLLLAGVLAGTEASALMIPLATTALVDRASCIVEGRVTRTESRWTDDHSAIVTEVEVEATEVLLGPTNRVTFLLKGGVVGDLEQRVSDTPAVTNGQHILVFLRERKPEEAQRDRPGAARDRLYMLVGAAQGLHQIEGGRAVKKGFTIVGDPKLIDRDVELGLLKTRIRERLGVSGRTGGRR